MKKLLITLLGATVLFGCQKDGGNEVVGKWVNLKWEKDSLEIVNNGDNFIVRQTRPSFVDGKMETKNLPASYRNGMLEVPSEMLSYTLDKASGHLTSGNAEYQKVQ